jgi:hypothetical protein
MARLSPETISSMVNVSATGMFLKAFLGFTAKMFENLREIHKLIQKYYWQN